MQSNILSILPRMGGPGAGHVEEGGEDVRVEEDREDVRVERDREVRVEEAKGPIGQIDV